MKITIEMDNGKVYEGIVEPYCNCKKCCFDRGKMICKEPFSQICNMFYGFCWREVPQEPVETAK